MAASLRKTGLPSSDVLQQDVRKAEATLAKLKLQKEQLKSVTMQRQVLGQRTRKLLLSSHT